MSRKINLTVHPGSNGPSLIPSKTLPVSGSSVTMTHDEYRTFCLYMLHLFQVMTNGSSSGLRFGKPVRINDTLKEVLYFLYADIAQLVAPGLSAHEQLEKTALALYSNNVTIPRSFYQTRRIDSETWVTTGRFFFDMSVAQRVSALSSPLLLDLTLNAVEDLDEIKGIVNRTPPEELPILLSAPGPATIAHLRHLNIQRNGTPLQMALYGGDEDIVAYLKTIMDPAEFERQSIKVFKKALSREKCEELDSRRASAFEYQNEMLIVQKAEAEKLCNDAFQFRIVDGKDQFTINDDTVAEFRQKLENYVRNNPIHNPFILRRLYEIYEKSPGIYAEDCLFSKIAIGGAHAFSSARWLQHYAQGIYYLGGGNGTPDDMRRSFKCSDSNPKVDVRSLIPRLGVDSFMSIFGSSWGSGKLCRFVGPGARSFGNFCRAKTASLEKLMWPAPATRAERRCVVQ
jgi:hypothetical protein